MGVAELVAVSDLAAALTWLRLSVCWFCRVIFRRSRLFN